MKKFMTFLTMITLVGCLVLTTSCKKKNDDPTPFVPKTDTTHTGGGTDTTTTTDPVIVITTTGTLVAPANVDISATIANLVADSIAKVELIDASNNVTLTLNTSPFSFSKTNLPAGTYNYIVKLTATNGTTKTEAVTFTVVNPNGAPTFTSTDLGQLTTPSNTYNVNISDKVSDPENDPITVTSVTTTANGVTVTNVSGTSFDINVPNTQYAGQITLSVTISDGTNSTTSNVTVKIGSDAKAATYGIMNSFINKNIYSYSPSPSTLNLNFNSNGDVTGTNNNSFWGANCTSGNWSIDNNGYLVITNCTSGTGLFTVTLNGSYLTISNVSTWYLNFLHIIPYHIYDLY